MKLIAPSKDQTALLPPFAGLPIERIHVPASAAEFEAAHAAILTAGTVGFDTESKPTFSVGEVSDGPQIRAKLGVAMAAVFDLNTHFRRTGYGSSMGVRAAVGVVLQQHFHKSKKITTTNWALPSLSDKQLLYAANDAFAALRVLQAVELLGDAHLA